MSEALDPELARALQEPARLVRADPALLDVVRDAGPAAQSRLRELSSDAGTTEDRYAAATMLAALFGDRGPLDQAARGYGGTPPRELAALADVPALRPALRQSLSSLVLTGLLEWATTPDAAHPPLELAMAARDLELTDSSVLLSVARRADQVAEQGVKRAQQGPLARFSEVLRAAAEAGSGAAAASSSADAGSASRPTPQEPDVQGPTSQQADPRSSDSHGRDAGTTSADAPGSRGPEVTTTGIPASEMLSEDEQHDPWDANYPGTGVPVRDSIAGPRQDAPPEQKDGKGKIFDAERFWPMGPPRSDRSGTPGTPGDDAPGAGSPRGGYDDAASAGAQVPPREPSTNDLYFGAGSDRWADRDPNSEETRAEDRHMARNWAIVFGVIVAVILVLVLLL